MTLLVRKQTPFIVQQLNCVGCVPAGLALAAAKKYPYCNSYSEREPKGLSGNACIHEHRAEPGTIDIRVPHQGTRGPRVINLFAQWDLGRPHNTKADNADSAIVRQDISRHAWTVSPRLPVPTGHERLCFPETSVVGLRGVNGVNMKR